jgi:biopolymer transport protein TolR
MSLRRGRARAELMGDINVVSLIDVMMLLLVIFMITAPIMQGGVNVELPEADAGAVDPDKSGLVITVKNDGVYIDQSRVTHAGFASSFKAIAAARASKGVYVQADKGANVQHLVSVLDVLAKAKVSVSIMTQPREDASPPLGKQGR